MNLKQSKLTHDEFSKKSQKVQQCNKENAYMYPQNAKNVARKDIKHITQPIAIMQEKQFTAITKIEPEIKNGKQLCEQNQQVLKKKLLDLYASDIQKNLIKTHENNNYKMMCLKNHQLTPHLRAKMVDWMIEVLCSYKCCDQSFFLAVCLMDSFLKNSKIQQTPNDLHLMGVACMFIACKYEEIYPFKLSTVYEKIAHKKLTQECIKLKEGEILQSINFNLCLTTPYDFLTLFIAEFKLNEVGKNGEKFEKFCVFLAKKVMHCYELLNSDSFANLSLAVIFVVIEELIVQNEEDANIYNEKKSEMKSMFKIEANEQFSDTIDQVRVLSKQFAKMFPSFENLKKFCGANEVCN